MLWLIIAVPAVLISLCAIAACIQSGRCDEAALACMKHRRLQQADETGQQADASRRHVA